ncbi:MAG: carbohydrate porin [Hyphomicrobiales bacterium]
MSFFAEGEIGPVIPFVRFGFSDGPMNGPAILNKMAAGGVGVREMFGQKNDLLGAAFSWGERRIGKIDTDEDGIPDTDMGDARQYAGGVFYRVQLTKRIAVTPSFQFILDPVFAPTKDTLTLVGIRGRFEM